MRVALVTSACIVLAACTWMQPIEPTHDVRRNVKVALAAYEATQQAMIIYGRLPGCDSADGLSLANISYSQARHRWSGAGI